MHNNKDLALCCKKLMNVYKAGFKVRMFHLDWLCAVCGKHVPMGGRLRDSCPQICSLPPKNSLALPPQKWLATCLVCIILLSMSLVCIIAETYKLAAVKRRISGQITVLKQMLCGVIWCGYVADYCYFEFSLFCTCVMHYASR